MHARTHARTHARIRATVPRQAEVAPADDPTGPVYKPALGVITQEINDQIQKRRKQSYEARERAAEVDYKKTETEILASNAISASAQKSMIEELRQKQKMKTNMNENMNRRAGAGTL